MPPVIPNPLNIHEFKSQADFERWLARNHNAATEVWIKVHKKASGLPSITPAEALDVALCWGWIDAIRKSFDEKSFLQRYTPRQKRSPWSVINTQHVARLTAAKRMQAPGQAQIDAAKADGRWDIAYSGSRDMKAPPELMDAINANAKAQAMYATLTSQNRYAFSYRLISIKTEATRTKRIAEYVAMLARGETFYPNRSASTLRAEAKAEGRAVSVKKEAPQPLRRAKSVAKSATKKLAASKGPAKKSAATKLAAKKSPAKKTPANKTAKRA